MSLRLRKNLAHKISTVLRGSSMNSVPTENLVVNALRIDTSNPKNRNIVIQLPIQKVLSFGLKNLPRNAVHIEASHLVRNFQTDEYITGISLSPTDAKIPSLYFNISPHIFIWDLLKEVLGTCENEFIRGHSFGSSPENVIVEFSSPNIAKPFHVGHLRSTIHGNFIANLHQVKGFNVSRLNYLGDWGTQFGLLQFGIEQQWYTWEEIQQNPIQLLLDIYIRANALAEKEPDVATKARSLFQKLEDGDKSLTETWSNIRHYTVQELTTMYKRLGVRFDNFEWESQYGMKQISEVLQALESNSLLFTTKDGKKATRLNNEKLITLVKSDGSSLYLTRDIAAAIDRFHRFKFRRMLYVVDNAQTDHFEALKQILMKMNYAWANDITHVKFGRINGMSTRKGTAIFLTDVLDEAYQRMRAKQLSSSTTKVDVESSPDTTNMLALSAVFIHDLKQRRQRDYTFLWDEALKDKGDTGLFLQYAHCRLSSLERKNGISVPDCLDDLDSSLIIEPEMLNLLKEVGRFHQVLNDSYEQLESCVLVRYLFDLSHAINTAIKTVQIKNQPEAIARVRLAVFSASKRTLGVGLKILGITPLEEM